MAECVITKGITAEHLQQVYSDARVMRTGHDHRPPAPIDHPLAEYLSAWVDGEFAGAFLAIRQSTTEVDMHSLLLPVAIHASRDLGRLALDWALSQGGVLRVTAQIIDGLTEAINFCKKIGMAYEGCRRHACLKDGVPTDVHVLGITKEEFTS